MARKPKAVSFKIDTGDGIAFFIQGDENSVKIDESGVTCEGDYGDDYNVLCTRDYFMDLFQVSERTLERWSAHGVLRPEPEKQGRKKTYNLFYNGYRIKEYLDGKSRSGKRYQTTADYIDDESDGGDEAGGPFENDEEIEKMLASLQSIEL